MRKPYIRHTQKLTNAEKLRNAYFYWKNLALLALGDKCKRCGFNDRRALQIDHVAGGGGKELRGHHGHSYFKKIMESAIRSEGVYQLLCANCNWIKRVENNEK